jgi:hypothetical protein
MVTDMTTMTDHEQLIEALRDLTALDEGIAFVNSGSYQSFPRIDAGCKEKNHGAIEALALLACLREIERRDLALLVSNVNRSDGLTNVAIFRRSDKQILASQSAPTAALALALALTEAIKATGADTIKATKPQHKRRWEWIIKDARHSLLWRSGNDYIKSDEQCQDCGRVVRQSGPMAGECDCLAESPADATQGEKACTDATQALESRKVTIQEARDIAIKHLLEAEERRRQAGAPPPETESNAPMDDPPGIPAPTCWQRLDDYVEKHSAKGSFNENIRDCLRDLRQQQMEQAATLAALVNDTPLTPAWVRTELEDLRERVENLVDESVPLAPPPVDDATCWWKMKMERDGFNSADALLADCMDDLRSLIAATRVAPAPDGIAEPAMVQVDENNFRRFECTFVLTEEMQ